MRWLVLIAVVFSTSLGLRATEVGAKGGPNALDYVEISGGSLTAPQRIPITLPDNYDYMSELFDQPVDAASIGRAGFKLLIHIAWPEERDASGSIVQKAQIWEIQGRYDGDALIYLAQMQHGNRAGWFVANPLFAEQLRAGVDPRAPAAGNSYLVPDEDRPFLVRTELVIGIIAMALGLGIAWSSRRFGKLS